MTAKRILFAGSVALALVACRGREDENAVANADAAANAAIDNAVVPQGPDLSSPAAAKAVVADYAALTAKSAYAEAERLWTDPAEAKQFAASLEDYPKVAITPGEPADLEGAAGSSFVTVPVALALTLRSGSPYDMNCKAKLRRVNDVPGATPDQLRWRIQSIDC